MPESELSFPDVTARSVTAVLSELGSGVPVERRETHMSVVLICGERVFKIRRALRFSFADHRSLDARRASAHAELTLNSDLAPGIYVAVHAVVESGGDPRLAVADDPGALDYVVEMRRFDEQDTLAARLRAGGAPEPLGAQIDALAVRLVEFHASAPADADAASERGPAAARMISLVDVEAAELVALIDDPAQRRAVVAIERRLDAAAIGLAAELAARGGGGLVREVHGDLRAEHVLLAPGAEPMVVDRLEYRRDLRTIDVADDLSFLVMDLWDAGEYELADRIIAAYAAAGGACSSRALLALYAARRALIRAKVDLVRAGQGGPDAGAARARATRLITTAARFAWHTHGGRVIVLCGGSGTGKSHLAFALSRASGIAVISSDLVRKELLGIAPNERAGESAYERSVTERVYLELGHRAVAVVEQGVPVIVDATCLRRADRDLLLAGLGSHSEGFVFVQCVAPDAVVDARVAQRAADPSRVSDATAEVVTAQRAAAEPLDEIAASGHIVLRTDRDVSESLAALAAALEA